MYTNAQVFENVRIDYKRFYEIFYESINLIEKEDDTNKQNGHFKILITNEQKKK